MDTVIAVTMPEDDELLFSRRGVDQRGARFVTQSFMLDTLRAGWTEAPAKRPARSSFARSLDARLSAVCSSDR